MKLVNFLFSSHLDEGEKIIDICHRHVLVFKFASFKVFIFGIILPVILYLLFPKATLVFAIWFGVGLIGMIYHFIDWYFDAWLLTNVGVIDIERNGLFDRSSTRVDYHMIEGIAFVITGFWQTIFNFGDITVDKLGNRTSVKLKDAANPKGIEKKVLKLQDKFVTDKSIRDHHALKDMLSEMIAYHVKNNKINNPYND